MSDKLEVIWIAGNHDGPATTISELIGLHVFDEYILTSGDKKIMVVHGDKWDKFITERPVLTWIGDLIYSLLQRIGHKYARMAKMNSKHYLHCQEVIREGATKYAKKHGCDAVCCGHVHSLYNDEFYYNSGCWTEPPGAYLAVRDGKIKCCNFDSMSIYSCHEK
jgi:UDP-2,3-diacylglucosamine pyrophosphatase LpxH